MDLLAAANALRNFDLFRDTSVRQLVDLAELAAPGELIPFGDARIVEGVILAVLSGRALVRTPGQPTRVVAAGDVFLGNPTLFSTPIEELITGHPMMGPTITGIDLGFPLIAGAPSGGALVLALTFDLLRRVVHASSSFATSVEIPQYYGGIHRTLQDFVFAIEAQMILHGGPQFLQLTSPPGFERCELIWMCESPSVVAPLEPLTRLVAAAAATQFNRPIAVVILLDELNTTVAYWDGAHEQFEAPKGVAIADLPTEFKGSDFRIFFARPDRPNVLPTAMAAFGFDRIVYVTDGLPTSVPSELDPFLKQPAAGLGEPYLSSFVASVLLDGTLPPRKGWGWGLVPRIVRAVVRDSLAFLPDELAKLLGIDLRSDTFRGEELQEEFTFTPLGITAKPRSRIERDACRVRLNIATLAKQWQAAQTGGTVDTYHWTAWEDDACLDTVDRWARAVCNKRVGLAVTGGGATSYRAAAVIKMLLERDVPVDVLGGISGSSALGAYYCRNGRAGLDEYASATGNALSILGALFSLGTSQFIETGTDWTFSDTRLDDLEIRFVPVTTAMPPKGPPQAQAVVKGTLGEAVRVSGAFPIFFARSVKNGIVYADGASATPIPARALSNYGADIVFGCNSVPAPDRRNPLDWLPGSDFAYRFTWAGRQIDMWVFQAFLMYRIARESEGYTHGFIEATPNKASLAEIFLWPMAKTLMDETTNDATVVGLVQACAATWQQFKG